MTYLFDANIKSMLKMYDGGASQAEIGVAFGLKQPMVCRLLKSIPDYIPRSRAKRNQKGDSHPLWAGENVAYKAAHQRVERYRGKPQNCEVCLDCSPATAKGKYEWCNLTGKYHDINDYRRMCRKCHRSFDQSRREPKYCVPSEINNRKCKDCGKFVSKKQNCAGASLSAKEIYRGRS